MRKLLIQTFASNLQFSVDLTPPTGPSLEILQYHGYFGHVDLVAEDGEMHQPRDNEEVEARRSLSRRMQVAPEQETECERRSGR